MTVSFVLLILLGFRLSFPLNPDQVPVCVVPPPPQVARGGNELIAFSFLVRTGSNRLQASRPEPCDIQMRFPGQHPSQTRYTSTLQHPGAAPWELAGCVVVCIWRRGEGWVVQGARGGTWSSDQSIRVSPGVPDTVPSSVTARPSPVCLTTR